MAEPIGQLVRQMRGQNGYGLREFARLLGISAAYLSDIEHGRRRLSDDMACRLAPHGERDATDWIVLKIDADIATLRERRRLLLEGFRRAH